MILSSLQNEELLVNNKPICVALVAGEASGDILGAGLMAAIKEQYPNVHFIGVGGSRMEKEGMNSLFPMERLSIMGLVEVLGRLPELIARRKNLIKTILEAKPDIFIGIDAPDFNLGIELKLRNAGIKTVHYVSPSVWAWKQKRIFKIKKACDLMLTLFPFEVDIYKQHQIPVCFVGHPLADTIPLDLDRGKARSYLGAEDFSPIVALMPGSRGGEVERLAPVFIETATMILEKFPTAHFLVPCANKERYLQLQTLIKDKDLPLTLVESDSQSVLAACDVVLIASGTATLEALLCGRPMVVAYKLSALTFSIAKRLVKTPYVSLPNLLAGRLLVPELLQDEAEPTKLYNALLPLLEGKVNEQTDNFRAIHLLLRKDASKTAAQAVLELVN